MHDDDGTVQTDRLDVDAHKLLILQLLEPAIELSDLGLAIHAGLDRVPVAEAPGQCPPLAAAARDVQVALTTSTLPNETLPRCAGKNCSMRLNCSAVISMCSAYHVVSTGPSPATARTLAKIAVPHGNAWSR